MNEHWERAGETFNAAVDAQDRLKWLERTELRMWAAVVVGGLSLTALLTDCKAIKVLAAAVGFALPAVWLALDTWRKRAIRATSRHVDRGREVSKS
jgi:hypothetical protein